MKRRDWPSAVTKLLSIGWTFLLVATGPSIAQETMFITGDNVGIGTDTPSEKLHVKDGNLLIEQAGAVTAELEFSANGFAWEIKNNPNTGRLTYFSPGGGAITAPFKFDRQAQENLFRVGVVAGDTVDINGKLVINGTDVTPDYVFDPDYPLESIEEHAAMMWQNRRLPALPGAEKDREEGVNVLAQSMAILEELEKAHIYIAQLNETIKELQAEVAQLKQQR